MFKHRAQNGLPSLTMQWGAMLLLLVVSLIPVGVLTYYAMGIAADSVSRQISGENLAAVNAFKNQVDSDFKQRVERAKGYAGIPRTAGSVAANELLSANEDMKNITLAEKQVERAFIVKKSGELWAAYPTQMNEDYKEQYSDEPWFQEVLESGQLSISSVYPRVPRSERNVHSFILFAAPVSFSGAVQAVLVLEYSARDLQQSVKAASGSYLFLLDQKGNTIIHPFLPPEKPVTDVYAGISLVQQAFSDATKAFSGQYQDPVTLTEMMGTFVPYTELGPHWVVVAQRPTAPVKEYLAEVRKSIGLMGLLLTSITLVIVVMLGREVRSNLRLTRELAEKNVKLRETDAIVRSSHDAIIGLGPDWTIRTWNSGAEALYGRADHDMIGQPFTYVLGQEHGEEFLAMKEKLLKGEDVTAQEMVHKKATGEDVPVALTLSRIPDDSGNVAGYSCIVRDITAQKEIETAKNDLLAVGAHQLKRPATAIKMILECMLDGDYGALTEEVKQQCVAMQKIAADQFKLINDYLNISRIERGVLELNRADAPLMKAVTRVVEKYAEPYKEKNLFLKIDEKVSGIIASMDEDKFVEALGNSVDNAWKHTATGGVTLSVFTENGQAIVEVTDTGEGMDAEMLGKLFTRDKVRGKNTQAHNSSGLGLYFAKQVMELHGGSVTVRSKVGEGTTFRYVLPLVG